VEGTQRPCWFIETPSQEPHVPIIQPLVDSWPAPSSVNHSLAVLDWSRFGGAQWWSPSRRPGSKTRDLDGERLGGPKPARSPAEGPAGQGPELLTFPRNLRERKTGPHSCIVVFVPESRNGKGLQNMRFYRIFSTCGYRATLSPACYDLRGPVQWSC
jgi:hypothetical protein